MEARFSEGKRHMDIKIIRFLSFFLRKESFSSLFRWRVEEIFDAWESGAKLTGEA
jgi:hypothetical protein